ncbi:LLM class flavin-dependent oxidoreductase, partial [Streptomyces sp. NPDC005921]
MPRPFRFGVNLLTSAPADEWRAKCRRAEQLGYDVILVPDHLGMPAPFPALVAAAGATERPRLGTGDVRADRGRDPGAAGRGG